MASGVDRLAELRRTHPIAMRNDTNGAAITPPPPSMPNNNDQTGKRRGGKRVQKQANANVGKASNDIETHLRSYEPVKTGIDVIQKNCAKLDALRQKSRAAATDKARKAIMAEVDQVISETSKEAKQIKTTLDKIKKENNEDTAKDSAKAQMRQNLFATHIRRFHAVVNDYNTKTEQIKRDLKGRQVREVKLVMPDIDDNRVEQLVDSGKAQDVIKQALISDNLQETVRVIEERHLEILRLEQQVLEIYELFRDLATLVDLQQESLDVIETRIENAKAYTEKAEQELNKAEDYQKKARARMCCILLIVIAVLVVILAPTLVTQINNNA